MLHEQQAHVGRHQRQKQPLLVASGKLIGGRRRGAHDEVGGDAFLSVGLGGPPVDPQPLGPGRQQEVLGDGEAADQPLLQAPGGKEVDPGLQVFVVASGAEVALTDRQHALRRAGEPGAGAQERALAASLEAGEADHFPCAHRQGVLGGRHPVFELNSLQREHRLAERHSLLLRWGHHPAEHHLDQLFGGTGQRGLAHQLAPAHHRDRLAEGLHFLELVGYEGDDHPLAGQNAQRGEEAVLLGGGDPRRRLVEDEHPGPQPEEAGDLQLLALTHRQRSRRCAGVELEPELGPDALQLAGGGRPIHPAPAAQQEVVEHGEGKEDQRVLVEHADTGPDGSPGGTEGHRLAVEEHLPGVGNDEAGEHLHERGLARPVLPEQAVDGPGFQAEVDPVGGPHRAVALVDAAQFQAHRARRLEATPCRRHTDGGRRSPSPITPTEGVPSPPSWLPPCLRAAVP